MTIFTLSFLLLFTLSAACKSGKTNERASRLCGLYDCDYAETRVNGYKEYEPLNNLTNIRPPGFIVYLPLYILNSDYTNAKILLSTTNTPNFYKDAVYEFVLQSNSIELFKQKDNKKLGFYISKNSHRIEASLEVLIAITESGYINFYVANQTEPVISTFDANVVPVEYLSFATTYGRTEFFYNCPSRENSIFPTISIENVKKADHTNSNSFSPLDLIKQCKWYETWDNTFKKSETFNVSDFKNIPTEDYLLKLPIYVDLAEGAHIFLSATKWKSWSNNYFDIEIKSSKEGKTISLRRITDSNNSRLRMGELPDSTPKQTRILIEFSKSGLLEVFVGYSSYKAIISYRIDDSLNIETFGFGSESENEYKKSRALFFFDCPASDTVSSEHPLLIGEKLTQKDDALNINCSNIKVWKSAFPRYLKLSSFNNIQSEGFLIRLPFYIATTDDAHILLTAGIDSDIVYEIGIPGAKTTRTFISKNNHVIAESNESSIFNENRLVKIVLEVTNAHQIRIFTDYNKFKPLLEVQDTDSLSKLQYINFSGFDASVEYFYNCKEIEKEQPEDDQTGRPDEEGITFSIDVRRNE